jgi:hypothetical protein
VVALAAVAVGAGGGAAAGWPKAVGANINQPASHRPAKLGRSTLAVRLGR